MDIAEVYRVTYYGPEDRLRGAIMVCDMGTGFQFLYKDKSLDEFDPQELYIKLLNAEEHEELDKKATMMIQPCIKTRDHILLSGPESSVGFVPDLSLCLFLFGDIWHMISIHNHRLGSKDLSVPLKRSFVTYDGTRSFSILYALFKNAVEARVKVKICNVVSAFGLYGVVAARTSAIKAPAYSSILFFKDEDEKVEVKPGNGDNDLALSRSVVGVPFGSELILQFGLCGDGDGKLVEHNERIEVTQGETSSRTVRSIPCGNQCLIEVEINWKSKRDMQL